MKRLAILSSLALLASPCFSSAICNGSALNQGRVFNAAAEGGVTYKEVVGTITFGENVGDGSDYNSTALKATEISTVCGSSGIFPSEIKFTESSRCFSFKDAKWTNDITVDPALKMGATSKNATASYFTVNFGEEAIIKQISLFAKQWDAGGQFTITASNGNSSSSETVLGSDSFAEYNVSSLGYDEEKASSSAKIAFTAKKRVYLSSVQFVFAVPDTSTAKTVTYDYGEVNYKNITNLDLKPSEAVEVDGTITNPLPKSYLYEDWTGLYEFVGWYTDKEKKNSFSSDAKITEDITLYAKWDVVENDAYTALKKSETKAQLNYKYETRESQTGVLSFGESKDANTNITTSNSEFYSFSGIDGVTSSVSSVAYTYRNTNNKEAAIRFGSGDGFGNITFK